MERDPAKILVEARKLPPIPQLPPITAEFKRRARDSYWHYHNVVTGRWQFPFYRTHRQGSIILDGIGWLWRLALRGRRQRQAVETLAAIAGRDFFVFPLQLTGDYQIRHHSPFGSMHVAVDYVLESFARFAPPETVLLVKEHPLDSGYTNWRTLLLAKARQLGIHGRVYHIDGGELDELSATAKGMVCVNSTSATLALEAGTPVAVLGDAI
jgi:capsular polysaccharide export protein